MITIFLHFFVLKPPKSPMPPMPPMPPRSAMSPPFLSWAFVQASAMVLFILSSPSSYIFFIMFMMESLGLESLLSFFYFS